MRSDIICLLRDEAPIDKDRRAAWRIVVEAIGLIAGATSEKALRRRDKCSQMPADSSAFPRRRIKRLPTWTLQTMPPATAGRCRPRATVEEGCRILQREHLTQGLRDGPGRPSPGVLSSAMDVRAEGSNDPTRSPPARLLGGGRVLSKMLPAQACSTHRHAESTDKPPKGRGQAIANIALARAPPALQ